MVSVAVAEEGWDKKMLVEPPISTKTSIGDCKFDDQLSDEQVIQLNSLIIEFQGVLSSRPGYTNLWERDIKLATDEPVRSKQYQISFAFKQVVINEVGACLI